MQRHYFCSGAMTQLSTAAKKLLVQSWTASENFINNLSFYQKLFNFLIRTDRRVPSHPYTDEEKILNALFDTFYFNTFALLNSCMKGKTNRLRLCLEF
jgi:hypothetical protein